MDLEDYENEQLAEEETGDGINHPVPLDQYSTKQIKKMKKKMSRKERRHTDFPNDPVKGRTFHCWAKFFFVLTCIGVGLTGAMLVLPFFLALFGIFSVLCWLLLILVGTIFTLGMIWLSDDTKRLNERWMSFNESIFAYSNNAADLTKRLIPSVLISGGIIIAITWVFLIVGIVNDKARTKKYRGKIIALAIFTFLYTLFLILNVISLLNLDTISTTSSIITIE